VIVDAARHCHEPIRPIHSGALHDAAVLAEAGVPCGMIFARSNADGASHTPEEDTDPAALLTAARLLAHSLATLATSES
jgi:N-carbamoyl-L-amino-acid hydrolase